MTQSFDVIVIGGGIVGISAALAMHQRHFSVALLDAGSLKTDTSVIDSRVYAINQASQGLFQSLSAWDLIQPDRVSPYQHMRIWDAVTNASIDFDARMIASDRLGTILEESVIKQALLKQIATQNIPTFTQARVSSVTFEKDGSCLVSDTHQSWKTRLLIVADGANSATRELLGVPLTTWPYHHHAIVSTVHTEKPHQLTAYQVFHPDGPLAFLPLTDPYQCSIVWSTLPSKAEALMQLADSDFAEQLTTAFNAKLGACTVLDKRHTFPLHMRQAKQYSGSNWVLMGDAAHTIHPLAGLGLNVGLADLTAFIRLLGENQAPIVSNKQRGAYHRQRYYEVWKMIALMGGLKSLFSNPLSPVSSLRGLGMQAVDHLLPLKRYLIEQATN